MQRIERYGVIALVFLLVTILAVSLWGESKQDLFAGDEELEPEVVASAPAAVLPAGRTSPVEHRGARDRSLPTSDAGRAGDARPRNRSFSRNPNVLEPEERPEKRSGARRAALPTPETAAAETRERRRRAPDERGARPATTYEAVDPLRESSNPSRAPEPQRQVARGERSAATCVVGRGETLSQISQRELGTYKRWREIAALNGNLDPAKLRAGMVLRLPGGERSEPAVARTGANSNPEEPAAREAAASRRASAGRSYTVQRGDVLSVIAQRELGSAKRWKEIVALNPKINPDRLLVGAKLALPRETRVANRVPSAAAAPISVARAEPIARAEPAAAGWSGARGGSKVR